MTHSADVVVVGAGPAGSTLAAQLALRGMRVLLVDKAQFPRQKVCGEFFSPATTAILPRLDPTIAQCGQPVDSLAFALPDGRSWSLPATVISPPPLALSRSVFDQRLLERAAAAGVEIRLGQRVRAVIIENGRACGVSLVGAGQHADAETIHAPLVMAADGRHSLVVRQTGRVSTRQAGRIGFKAHFRYTKGAMSRSALTMHSLPGGYVGVCAVEPDVFNVCGVAPRNMAAGAQADLGAALLRWAAPDRQLGTLMGEGKLEGQWHAITEVGTQTAFPSVAGVLYVGDAALAIEPLAGQGIAMALRGALAADEFLTQHDLGAIDRAAQQQWALQLHEAFHHSQRWAARCGWLLRHPRLLGRFLSLGRVSDLLAPWITRQIYRATTPTDSDIRRPDGVVY
jgi:flavin-dependent dehydrogenase